MHNPYRQAKFLLSAPSLAECPVDQGYEIVFAGRSNAGKSSAINAITQQKKLAKVSKTPGRTQHLVFFELDKKRRLVDLPGYGYAKVNEKIKKTWYQNMDQYFDQRQCLTGVILIMDCRHPLKPFDQMMLDWCIATQIPTHVLLTKADKLTKNLANSTLLKLRDNTQLFPFVSAQLFSSLKKQGLRECWEKLNQLFNLTDES